MIEPLKFWIYQNNPIFSIDDIFRLNSNKAVYGFIYCVTFTDNLRYLGKKALFEVRTMHCLKDNQKRQGHVCFLKKKINHKFEHFEQVKFQTDWLNYQGSCQLCRKLQAKEKKILAFAESKRQLTYLENKYLFKYDILERENFLNSNIEGRYFRGNLV